MLKQATDPHAAGVETTTELWAFFRGDFVPLRDANVNVMTHGFNYGTAVFEGVRAYWNADDEQLYALELLAHYTRIQASARMLMMVAACHSRRRDPGPEPTEHHLSSAVGAADSGPRTTRGYTSWRPRPGAR